MNPSAAPLTSNYQRDTVQARFTLLIENSPRPDSNTSREAKWGVFWPKLPLKQRG